MKKLTNNNLGIILILIGAVFGIFAAMVARQFILFSCIVFAIGIIFFVIPSNKPTTDEIHGDKKND